MTGNAIILESIERHQYPEFIVSLSIEIYVRCHCGFRRTVGLLSYLNHLLGWKLEKISGRNSIENRVKKSGYSIYQEPLQTKPTEHYAEIHR
jgi:hypothetical protein